MDFRKLIMKHIIVLITLYLVLAGSFNSESYSQSNQLTRQNPEGISDTIKKNSLPKDTIFFNIDPNDKGWTEYDSAPDFPGGIIALRKYISENTNYPISAIKDSVEGVVRIMFTIDIDGSTKNFRVISSIQKDLDNECIRVIKEMPRWKPGIRLFGTIKGSYTTVAPWDYIIPFNFVLKGGENPFLIYIKPK
jgi:TonB family protein